MSDVVVALLRQHLGDVAHRGGHVGGDCAVLQRGVEHVQRVLVGAQRQLQLAEMRVELLQARGDVLQVRQSQGHTANEWETEVRTRSGHRSEVYRARGGGHLECVVTFSALASRGYIEGPDL